MPGVMSDKEIFMTEDNFDQEIEESDELDHEQQQMSVSKPWYLYLMAVWAFFGVGGYAMSLSRTVLRENQQFGQLLSITVLVFIILLIIKIVRMNKKFLIINGVLCSLIALWCGSILVRLLLIKPGSPAVYLLLFYILPSAIVAFVSFRPSFLAVADRYGIYRNQEMLRKAALKNAGIR